LRDSTIDVGIRLVPDADVDALVECFEAIRPNLDRYPAIDADSSRALFPMSWPP
jgi:hypothetical protein